MLFRLAMSVQSMGCLPITTLRMQPLKLSRVPNVPLGAPSATQKIMEMNVNEKVKCALTIEK